MAVRLPAGRGFRPVNGRYGTDPAGLGVRYDRSRLGMILTGMPGIGKRLARYPHLYSRTGFVHEYRTLSAGELVVVLQHHWSKLGLTLSAGCSTPSRMPSCPTWPGHAL